MSSERERDERDLPDRDKVLAALAAVGLTEDRLDNADPVMVAQEAWVAGADELFSRLAAEPRSSDGIDWHKAFNLLVPYALGKATTQEVVDGCIIGAGGRP